MSLAPLTPHRVFFWMKTAAVLGIALLFILLYFAQRSEDSKPLTVLKTPSFTEHSTYRKKAPVFEWDNNEGQTLAHKDFIGQWTLLNFWAHWCWPCHVEIPLLNTATLNEFKDLNLKVILINTDKADSDHQKMARDFLSREKIQITNLFDAYGLLARDFEVAQYPYHVLISPQGEIVFSEPGAIDWASPKVIQSLKELLTGAETASPSAKSE